MTSLRCARGTSYCDSSTPTADSGRVPCARQQDVKKCLVKGVSELRFHWIISAATALLVAAMPIFAHHSFAAEYDSTKKVELKGTVTKFEWTNPHAHFYLDVKAD